MDPQVDRQAFILRALEMLDAYCDRQGLPMSIRVNLKAPWRVMLEEIEEESQEAKP